MAGPVKKMTQGEGGNGSPQASSQAMQRTRIIEPQRKKFETQWERWMEERYIAQPIKTIPEKQDSFLVPPAFDVRTKVESQNAKVILNKQLQEYQKEKQV